MRPAAPQSRWHALLQDDILEGDWEAASAVACPVVVTRLPNGQPGAEWKPFDWKLMQRVWATVTQYGLFSEASRHLITYVFGANVMTPSDCMSVVRLILSPSQYLLWEKEREQQCQRVVAILRAAGDPLHGVQIDMLLGQGPYADPNIQLTFLTEMHNTAADAARQALFLVPYEKRPPSFTSIKQGVQDPYGNFVNCLVQALERAPDLTDEMRAQLLHMLAHENANSKAKFFYQPYLRLRR